MNKTISLMRLQIEGRWSTQEFGQVLLSITDLYNVRLVLEVLKNDWHDLNETWREMSPPWYYDYAKRRGLIAPQLLFTTYPRLIIPTESDELLHIAESIYPGEMLEVRRIRYGSPGTADITGIGAIVGHVKDLIIKIIEYCVTCRQRDLDNDKREAEIAALRIQNAQAIVSLAKQCGYSRSEFRKLVGFVDTKQEAIVQVVDQAKLVGVNLIEHDESSTDSG